MTFVPVRVTGAAGRPDIAWADGLSFTLPRALVERMGWSRLISAEGELTIPAGSTGVEPADATAVRDQRAFTETPPASARLPISYQFVPGAIRAAVGSFVGRRQRSRASEWAQFPGWPLDLTTDLLSDLAAVPRPALGDKTPVLLTHDIDSPEGLRSLVDAFLPLEERAGARSTSYVVPCAWTPDAGALDDVQRRGHEIGVHGYDHSNRTPFANEPERRRRLDAARPFAEHRGAVGYRAPSLLRTRALLRDLSSRYAYDSSIPTSGGPFPVPNNGCATARPFVIEGVLEIPLTLPRDGSLRFLGYSAPEILQLWITCAETIARSGGVVTVLTHCEARFSGNDAMLDAYRRFLDHVGNAPHRFAFTTPALVATRLRHAQPV